MACPARDSGRGPGASRPAAPPDAANVLGRGFDGHRLCTHVAADLTDVRAGSRWCYVCLLVDLHDREIVGCSCGRRKDVPLVKAAFSNVEFPLTGIEVFHSDRGAEFRDAEIDAILIRLRGSIGRSPGPATCTTTPWWSRRTTS